MQHQIIIRLELFIIRMYLFNIRFFYIIFLLLTYFLLFLHYKTIKILYKMETLIVTTDTVANAKFLASFLKTVKPVKSVLIEKKEKYTEVSEPEEEYNWINPSCAATDEEFEQMIVESMKGKAISAETSQKRNLKKFEKWCQKNSK